MHLFCIICLATASLLISVEAYVVSQSNVSSARSSLGDVNSNATTRLKQQADIKAANQSENSLNEDANQAELELYWLNQRDQFFNQTTFNLSRVSAD